ncbi:MAG: adenylate/guanylate cyclase domain-containing protein, partial [Gaiellaceae bacterium]
AEQAVERRKVVTLLFCDVAGSTALGERFDAESVRTIMLEYFDEMRAAIERHGGTVEKFIGDAVMAVFGVPTAHEDDALRALRAAGEMLERLERLNAALHERFGPGLALRIGVNTGEVVAGDATTRQTVVTGDAVNVAARLEQAASPGEVLLGESTYAAVRGAVTAEPVEPIAARGKSEPVAAFRLLSVARGGGRRPRRRERALVGRARELAWLRTRLELAVRERRCVHSSVVGEAGVGKSRLLAELVATRPDEAAVLRGGCLSYGEGITYWPLAEIVRQAAGVHEGEGRARSRARIADLLSGEPDGETAAAVLAEAIGLAEGGAQAVQIAWAARTMLEAIGRKRPLLVLLEDLHWAEPTLLDLVDHVVATVSDAPVHLVTVARPELHDRRPGWAEEAIRLEPLGEDESSQLMAALLGGARLEEQVRARVLAASEGNPLFVEEYLAELVDSGLLRLEDGCWRAADDLAAVATPPTIDALLESRLDGLAAGERGVLERGSVEGRRFHRAALVELGGPGEQELLTPLLERLLASELVQPAQATYADGEAFAFRHALIREAAYRGISKRVRADLHERFAGWLERVAGDRVVELEEVLGYHLEQAHRCRVELARSDAHARSLGARAAGFLASAGRRAFARGDFAAAANLLERAASLLEGEPRLELLPDLGAALRESGEFRQAGELLGEALAESAAAGEERVEARATVEHGFLLIEGDPEVEAEDVERSARGTIPVFERHDDAVGLSRAWMLVAQTQWVLCRCGAVEDALRHARRHAGRAHDSSRLAWIANAAARAVGWGPTPVDVGLARLDELAADSEGDRQVEVVIAVVAGFLEAMRGRFGVARGLVDPPLPLERSREQGGDRREPAGLAQRAQPVEADAQLPLRRVQVAREQLDRAGEGGERHRPDAEPELERPGAALRVQPARD